MATAASRDERNLCQTFKRDRRREEGWGDAEEVHEGEKEESKQEKKTEEERKKGRLRQRGRS